LNQIATGSPVEDRVGRKYFGCPFPNLSQSLTCPKKAGMKRILLLVFVFTVAFSTYAQNPKEPNAQQGAFQYAYVTIEGKGFSKKLEVVVDLGDAPEQVEAGKKLSQTLTNKKSYAAVLNYMDAKGYELISYGENSFSFQGTGGTQGIILIMRKRR